MNTIRMAILLAALPLAALAQSITPPGAYVPVRGDRELILGGNGASNKEFDNSSGGVFVSLGSYFNDTLLGSIRQTASYTNPDVGGDSWDGSTKIALDKHLGSGNFRPFVGANFGGYYGDTTTDTFAAGLEAGFKKYTRERTFIFVQGEYGWLFRKVGSAGGNFSNGRFNWALGVGFNY